MLSLLKKSQVEFQAKKKIIIKKNEILSWKSETLIETHLLKVQADQNECPTNQCHFLKFYYNGSQSHWKVIAN